MQVWYMHYKFISLFCVLITCRTTQQAAVLTGTCITFNHSFHFLPFCFYTLGCSFSPPWLTLSCFSLLPKTILSQFLSPHWSQLCYISPWFSISDTIADVLMALCEIFAIVAWALLALHDCTHQKIPSSPLQLCVKFAHWSHNSLSIACEIQPFFTTISIKFISFSLNLSIVSHFHFIFAWVVLACPVQLALTSGRAQAATSLLSWALTLRASS